MTAIKSIVPENMTDEGVNVALKPCLEKLQAYLAQNFPSVVTILDNDDDTDRDGRYDGNFLAITYKEDVVFKVLGSQWHSRDQVAYLNVVQLENAYIKAHRGQQIERAEIDGSKDLQAEFLDWYEWLESVVTNLLEGNH